MQWQPPADGTRRFLLLDGAQCKAPSDVLARITGGASAIDLFDGVLADGSGDATVKLARLEPETDLQSVFRQVTASIKSLGAFTFIDSALAPNELAQRLMRRLDAKLPNGKSFLARFYDGRVLPLLLNVMTPAQRGDFLALGATWWYIAHNHVWSSFELGSPEHDPFQPPLRLDDAQRRSLLDDTYPYTLIDHFAFTDHELLDRVPANDQYRFIRHCTRVANEFGIRDGKRVVMVCAWALLLDEDYYLDPMWQQRLKDLSSGKRTARDIGNEVWPVEETWD